MGLRPDRYAGKRRNAHLRINLAIAIALLICGCAVGPHYRSPDVTMPASFALPTTTATTRPVDPARWWEALGDPQLNSLIQRALESNLDLRIANARLQEARSIEFATTGGIVSGIGYLPAADVSAAAGRGSGTNTTRGRVGTPLNAASNSTGLKEITQVIGLDAGWELDLFGHYSHLVEASNADVAAVAEARNDILITLFADVVRSYADVRSEQYRLDVALQNLATQQRTLDIVRIRVQRQLGDELDLALAERQRASTLSRIAPLRASLAAAKRRVSVLVGMYPEALKAELDQPGLLPSTPPNVAAGMPLELLRRRPDIRRSERELAASTARIGVAMADLYPRVSVTAGAGIQGQGLGRTPEQNRYIYSVGPALYWPFLDFGRLDATVQAQDFRTQQLLLTLRRTVIVAVREVDDALGNYAADQDSLKQLGDAVTSSRRAVKLAQERYDIGLTDFLNVLDAERQLFELQDQYATGQATVVRDFVAVYKALGGGWENYLAPAPPPPPRPALLAAFDLSAHGNGAKP